MTLSYTTLLSRLCWPMRLIYYEGKLYKPIFKIQFLTLVWLGVMNVSPTQPQKIMKMVTFVLVLSTRTYNLFACLSIFNNPIMYFIYYSMHKPICINGKFKNDFTQSWKWSYNQQDPLRLFARKVPLSNHPS